MSLQDMIRFIFSETIYLSLLCSILREVSLVHSGLLETRTNTKFLQKKHHRMPDLSGK